MPISAERRIANRVAKKLAGGGERYRLAEVRRGYICTWFHSETENYGEPIGQTYAAIGIELGISASTVRSIHAQHCRRISK